MAKKTISKESAQGGRAAARKPAAEKKPSGPKRKWSQRVTETSDAMTLKDGVFKSDDPKEIARSVMKSAENSKRRKTNPYRSAVSMISFYENRGGKNLSAKKRKVLQEAKEEGKAKS